MIYLKGGGKFTTPAAEAKQELAYVEFHIVDRWRHCEHPCISGVATAYQSIETVATSDNAGDGGDGDGDGEDKLDVDIIEEDEVKPEFKFVIPEIWTCETCEFENSLTNVASLESCDACEEAYSAPDLSQLREAIQERDNQLAIKNIEIPKSWVIYE